MRVMVAMKEVPQTLWEIVMKWIQLMKMRALCDVVLVVPKLKFLYLMVSWNHWWMDNWDCRALRSSPCLHLFHALVDAEKLTTAGKSKVGWRNNNGNEIISFCKPENFTCQGAETNNCRFLKIVVYSNYAMLQHYSF